MLSFKKLLIKRRETFLIVGDYRGTAKIIKIMFAGQNDRKDTKEHLDLKFKTHRTNDCTVTTDKQPILLTSKANGRKCNPDCIPDREKDSSRGLE